MKLVLEERSGENAVVLVMIMVIYCMVRVCHVSCIQNAVVLVMILVIDCIFRVFGVGCIQSAAVF
jgi:hypothetical protein